jgi:Ulp1 family protease
MTSPSPSASQTFKNNELLINYHDAVIYGWELKLIERRTDWLNDSCIHFFFTHLQQLYPLNKTTTVPPATRRPSFLFMDPSVVSFWMHQCIDRDEIDDFVKNTQFPGKCSEGSGAIFIAVNDNMSTSSNKNPWQLSDRGSHWSLLVVEVVISDGCEKDKTDLLKKTLRFWHFDSIFESGNIRAAEDIAAKICLHVYPEASIMTKSSSLSKNSSKAFEGIVQQAETPQQQNGYDCGVHVLGAAKILSKYVLMTQSTSNLIGTSDSPCHRLQDLEKCLRNEIDKDSHDFCSKLRHQISSEIRFLHKEMNR